MTCAPSWNPISLSSGGSEMTLLFPTRRTRLTFIQHSIYGYIRRRNRLMRAAATSYRVASPARFRGEARLRKYRISSHAYAPDGETGSAVDLRRGTGDPCRTPNGDLGS
jgi:hypothetical protein